MTGIEQNKSPAGNRFPMKILAIALVLSMALFIGLGWYTWNSYRQFKIIQEQHFPLQKLTGIIIHLDEVLTMSARMAAATGDVRWEERYRSFESKLDGAIKETIQLAPEAYEGESAAQTDAANIQLVKMENQAFALVRQGKHEAASKLLSSTEYEQQKRIYAMGMENISAAIKGRVEAHLHSQRRSVLLAVAAIVIALPALIFSWIGVLRTVGRHLAERRQTDEKIQRNLQRIAGLREINLATTSTLDLHAVLKLLMDKIDLVLPYSATTVRLFNQESRLLEPIACRNLDEKEWRAEQWKGGHGIPSVVFEKKAPQTVRNVQTDARVPDPEFFRKHGLVSYLGVPLIVKDEILGVLSFYTKEEHEFASEEVEFLSVLANQAAMAIHNSRLFEETKASRDSQEAANQRLSELLGELSRLYAALTPLDPSGSLREMLDKVSERLIAATGADAALVRVQERASGAFTFYGQRGFPARYMERVPTVQPGSALHYVFTRGEPIISADIAADPRLKGKVQLEVGFRSCAMLPLKVGTEVRGVVHLASREVGYFREEKKEHLMAIARQMGIAIENRELFDEISAARDELEKASKVKDEFLRFVSHELRTPINAVLGYAAMIQDGLYGEVHGEQRETLGKIMSRSHDLLSMVNGLLEATRIEAGRVRLERDEVNLSEFLGEVRSTYDVRLDKELTLIWNYPSDLSTLETDKDKLRHILQNLINNAIKYTDKGSVTISAKVIESSKQKAESSSGMLPTADRLLPTGGGRWVEFRVTDTGIGIPKESLTSVFEMFQQVKGSRGSSRGGVGLGLHIVKKFTELIGGEIEVESAPGKGSTFTVTIPCDNVPFAAERQKNMVVSS